MQVRFEVTSWWEGLVNAYTKLIKQAIGYQSAGTIRMPLDCSTMGPVLRLLSRIWARHQRCRVHSLSGGTWRGAMKIDCPKQ